MRTLCLLRHAKSSWDEPGLDDHARPLARRGHEAAPRIGVWLRQRRVRPDLVLVSTAVRAAETWRLIAPSLEPDTVVRARREIYLAEPPDLLRLIRGTAPAVGTLLLIGHNPGLGRLASSLVGDGPAELRQRMRRKFPTATLALIGLPVEGWSEVSAGIGTLEAFIRPKDLSAAPTGGS